MTRIGEGRYLFGDKSTQIFVRILRNHVMVRVGGGWDTLSHFLSKYDECRKVNPVTSSKILPSNQNGNCPQVDTKDKNNLIKAVKDSKYMGKYLSNGELNKDFVEGRLNAVKKRTSALQGENNNNTSERQIEKRQLTPGRHNSEYRNEYKKCTMDYSTPKKETGILSKSKFFSEINLATLNDDEVSCSSHLPRYKITGGFTHNNNNVDNNKKSTPPDEDDDNGDVYTRDNIRMRNADRANMNDIQSIWHMNQAKSSNNLHSSSEKLCTSTPLKQKFGITIIRPSAMREQKADEEREREQQKTNYANRSYSPKDAYYIHSPRMWTNNTDSSHDFYPVQRGVSDALISQDFSKSLTSLNTMIPKQSTNRRSSKPLEQVSVLTITDTIDDELHKSHPHPYGGLHQSSATSRKYSAPTRSTLITADYPVKGKKSALQNSKVSNSNNNTAGSSNQSKSQTKRGKFSSVFSPKTPPPSRASKTGKAVSSSTSTKHIDPQSDYKPVQIVYNSEENENYDRFDNVDDMMMNRRHHLMTNAGRYSDNSNKDHNGQIISMESQSRRGSLIPVSTRSYSTSRIPVRQH
ncbi:unnamed protein product [Trichobilharzia szidati]|nr:unnamed protein product [Trichobilharzia szidati]